MVFGGTILGITNSVAEYYTLKTSFRVEHLSEKVNLYIIPVQTILST